MSVYLDKAYEYATEYMKGFQVEKTWQDIYTKMNQFVDTSHYLSLPCDTRLSYMDVWNNIHKEFFHALQTEEIYQDTNQFACVLADEFFFNGQLAIESEVFITFDDLSGQETLSFDQLVMQNHGGVVSLTDDYCEWIMDPQDLIAIADKHFQPLDPSIPLSNIQPTSMNASNIYNGVQLGAMQYREMLEAETYNLSKEQMNLLNNSSFNCSQLHELANSFYNGVSLEQAQTMIDNGLSGGQIYAISNAVSMGCTKDEIANLISSNDRPCVMNAKVQGLVHNYESAELDSLFELSLSDSQIAAINKGLRNEVSLDSLSLAANPSLDFSQTEVMVSALSYGFSKNDVAEMDIANMNFSQTRQVSESMAINTPKELISTFANPSFTATQMVAIQDAIDAGISLDAVKTVANVLFTPEQMRAVTEAITNQIDLETIKELANPAMSPDEMRAEFECVTFGGIE